MAFSVSLSPLRRRPVLLALIVLFVVPFCFVMLASGPDMSDEQSLVQRLAEMHVKLQHLDSMHRARQEEVHVLSQHLGQLLAVTGDQNISSVSPEVRVLLRNFTGHLLRPPSVYYFLPHLLDSPASLRPAYSLSRARTGVSVVLGVPTVKRDVQSYLLATLQNIVDGMSDEEAADTLIVVLVAETDREYVVQVASEIKLQFTDEVEMGLIEVISPPLAFYPDMDALRITLGDSLERVKWRAKQNLDFAFLMMYAQTRGTFYVQLEDDILAKKNFVTTMRKYALQRTSERVPWFVIEFCQLGFIGKMFKCMELPWLINFFLMFYNDKPCDWLLDHLIYTKICNLEKDIKQCKKAKEELWLHYKPSLFQHIGTHSSLKGKVQKLKDKQFGKVSLFFPHKNPEAKIESAIKNYKLYSLDKAYRGESFFWGLLPQSGDHLLFTFKKPLCVRRYLFRSGNAEHPSDRFYNTTIEVSSQNHVLYNKHDFNATLDGFIVVGKFDVMGVADGFVDPKLCPVTALRLTVHSDSDNWAILSEIHVVSS